MFLIIVSGTPGTGKTTVSNSLTKELGCIHLTATDILRRVDGISRDPTGRDTYLATDEGLERASQMLREIISRRCVILETVFPRDFYRLLDEYILFIILLRCNPIILEERLRGRSWSRDKIVENVLAEAFNIIAEELIEIQYDVIEIDTTHKDIDATLDELENKIVNWETGIRIDWLSDEQVINKVSTWSLSLDRDKHRLGV